MSRQGVSKPSSATCAVRGSGMLGKKLGDSPMTLPVMAAVVGAIVAIIRPPGPMIHSGVQHFAAGVVFAAVALELLPDFHEQSPLTVALGFGVGIGAMLGLRWLTRSLEGSSPGENDVPLGLLATLALDFLVDGLTLGAGFTAAENQDL